MNDEPPGPSPCAGLFVGGMIAGILLAQILATVARWIR